MKYMLDTNICIGLIRQKPPSLIKRLTECEPGDVGVSTITVAELMHGAQKSSQVEKNMSALEQFLLPIEVTNFDHSRLRGIWFGAHILGKSRKFDWLHGHVDWLARFSLSVILVTNNTGEFSAHLRFEGGRLDGLNEQ